MCLINKKINKNKVYLNLSYKMLLEGYMSYLKAFFDKGG